MSIARKMRLLSNTIGTSRRKITPRLSILGRLKGYVACTIAVVCEGADRVLRNSFLSVFSSSDGFGRMRHCLRLPRLWIERFRTPSQEALEKLEEAADLGSEDDTGKCMEVATRLR
jgi:hypothetical protein